MPGVRDGILGIDYYPVLSAPWTVLPCCGLMMHSGWRFSEPPGPVAVDLTRLGR